MQEEVILRIDLNPSSVDIHPPEIGHVSEIKTFAVLVAHRAPI
jgi:hypothetical protein